MQFFKSEQKIAPEILEQAADWLVILHSGEITETQLKDFETWKNAHPTHQQAIERVEQFTQHIDILPATINTGKIYQSQQKHKQNLTQKLLFIILPIACLGIAYHFLPWQLWQADLSSKVGEVKSIKLNDGSLITLASNSYINVDYDQQHRVITLLQGEIYIQTAKDQQHRPFFVYTTEGAIRALGTKFSVRQDNIEHTDTSVQVYEHAVQVTSNHQSKIIKQGYQLSFDIQHLHPQQPLVLETPYWTQHLLVVDNWPLEKVISELYRYQTGRFYINQELKNIRVSAILSLKNPKQSLETLAHTYHFKTDFYTPYFLHIK